MNQSAKPQSATTYLKLDTIPAVNAEGMITLTGVLEKDGSEEAVLVYQINQ